MMEVIFALALQEGVSEESLLEVVRHKRSERGGFRQGFLLDFDARPLG